MSKLLTGSIKLSKIDKNKLFTSEKGEKFLNIAVWINDEKDQYGNDASVQQQTKKDEDKIYIGNLKFYEPQNSTSANNTPVQNESNDDSSGLPF